MLPADSLTPDSKLPVFHTNSVLLVLGLSLLEEANPDLGRFMSRLAYVWVSLGRSWRDYQEWGTG